METSVDIDEYISEQSTEVADRLRRIRSLFHELLPDAQESIRYDMPAFKVGSDHLYVGAYKEHIGMYPMYGITNLDEEMLPYRGKGTKDALHFKHSEPVPYDLIRRIIITKSNITE